MARYPLLGAIGVALTLLVSGCDRSDPVLRQVEQPSIVVVVVDTLRNDHLGHTGYGRETSPNIDRLAREGRVFSRVAAASPWTGPSVASIVTGRYPDELGIRDLDDPLPKAATTLAEVFRDNGWNTAAIVSNGYIAPWFGHDQGYEYFYKEEYLGDDDTNTTPVCTADRVTDKTIEWLKDAQEPFLLYVHYTDPHEPYLPPLEWKERFASDDDVLDEELLRGRQFTRVRLSQTQVKEIEAMYDASIAFADHEIGRLLEHVPDDVLVVLTGDHGEEFLDHGGFLHGHTVFEELIEVPLLFRGPGIEPGTADDLASHVDVAPTLISYAGLPPLPDPTGTSLVRALAGKRLREPDRTIFAVRELGGVKTVSARRDNWKLIYQGPRSMGLFDLHSDPQERLNRAREHSDVAQTLLHAIEERVERIQDAPPLDSEELENRRLQELRSLGYIN